MICIINYELPYLFLRELNSKVNLPRYRNGDLAVRVAGSCPEA
jgi:hypothetical protein